ncbi:hypothetical protein [Aliivibrio fischeri]|uniref:hypothetical protein n=1 Tax=Aliivibrio fischeri TaxID=668 RepID=UPI0007C59307|nr:hypothetical protein [Aliivibrio fischeri]
MAYNGMNRLFGAWRAQESAETFSFSQQVSINRRRHALSIKNQISLIENGANENVMLGTTYKPKFIYPRGKAWVRIAELSGL